MFGWLQSWAQHKQMVNFCSFTPLRSLKVNIFKKQKRSRDILNQCSKNYDPIMYGCMGIPCKGQPEAHYSNFPFQHEYLTLDLTKIHEKFFFP